MFWNKKVTLDEHESSKRYISDRHHFAVSSINLLQESLETKLDLILDHLKLKYVPETETKEPAKLVDNTVSLVINWGILGNPYAGTTQSVKETPKKRGRPKKK